MNDCKDCATINECDKATHIENYQIDGCMDFKVNHIDISDAALRAIKSNGVVLIPRDDPKIEFVLSYETIINDFKTALLKKIFPYDAADKKQYSINAYAVERAIVEVAEELIAAKEEVTSND